jgi:hypothetical protein
MGWTVYYKLERDTPLTTSEQGRLTAHVAAYADHPWEREGFVLSFPASGACLAQGFTKPPDDTDHDDWRVLLQAVTQLRTMIDGATLSVGDDYDCVYWDEDAVAYSNGLVDGSP